MSIKVQRLQWRNQALEAAQMLAIVRHGNTFESGEEPRRIGARTDLPLTAKGFEQADALGDYFAQAGLSFDRVLISPLTRARQTAERILARQVASLETETAEFLREIDYGPDENCPESKVIARIGKDALDHWERHTIAPEGWLIDADQRISAWRSLLAEAALSEETTLLVTSNGAARFALFSDPNVRQAATDLPSLKLPTGGFGVLVRDDSAQWSIAEWGRRP